MWDHNEISGWLLNIKWHLLRYFESLIICLVFRNSQKGAGNSFAKCSDAPENLWRTGKCGMKSSWHLHSRKILTCCLDSDDVIRKKARRWGRKVKNRCREIIPIPCKNKDCIPLSWAAHVTQPWAKPGGSWAAVHSRLRGLRSVVEDPADVVGNLCACRILCTTLHAKRTLSVLLLMHSIVYSSLLFFHRWGNWGLQHLTDSWPLRLRKTMAGSHKSHHGLCPIELKKDLYITSFLLCRF